jgi:hypothetical protein
MQLLKYLGPIVALTLLGYWIFSPSSPEGNASENTRESVPYICRETKQVVLAPLAPVPVVNSQTGRATLFRALYCPDCKKWHAVPPPDVFPGNPLTYPCPKHRHVMTTDGPLDESKPR